MPENGEIFDGPVKVHSPDPSDPRLQGARHTPYHVFQYCVRRGPRGRHRDIYVWIDNDAPEALIASACGVQKSTRPVNCTDDQRQPSGIMISSVPPSALSHLRLALRLAGLARPVVGLQERLTARATARGRCAAPRQSPAPAGLGQPRNPRRPDPALYADDPVLRA
jgi:hypothetical protein